MSTETPPRLNVGDTSQGGYAPISWTAVASLIVAGLFMFVLFALIATNYGRGMPLVEPWLLIFPALAVVLAFVSRRQILASEGTRTGIVYANYGWWIAIVGGLGYVAYLGAIEFAIRRDAEQAFQTWANHLKDLDPANPQDPNFYAAAHLTLEPGFRSAVNPKDVPAMDAKFRDPVAKMRQLDVVRICARNRGNVSFSVLGLKDWQQKADEISCVLSATLTTPEGERGIVVPLKATIDKNKVRRWQVVVQGDEFVKTRTLTRYGWLVEVVEANGKQFAGELYTTLAQPGGSIYAYLAFIQPGWDPERSAGYYRELTRKLDQRASVVGGLAVIYPYPPGSYENLTERVFAKPGGQKPNADELARFLFSWNNAGRLVAGGGAIRVSPETQSTLVFDGDRIELRVPCELVLGLEGQPPPMARGRLVLVLPPGADPELAAELKSAKAMTATSDIFPSDMPMRRIPWRTRPH